MVTIEVNSPSITDVTEAIVDPASKIITRQENADSESYFFIDRGQVVEARRIKTTQVIQSDDGDAVEVNEGDMVVDIADQLILDSGP